MISLAGARFTRVSSSTASPSGAIGWLLKCFLIMVISALFVIIFNQIFQNFREKLSQERMTPTCTPINRSTAGKYDEIPSTAFDIPMCYDRNYEPISRREVLFQGKIIRRRAFLTLGIPTIQRIYNDEKASYFVETLNKLIKQIPKEHQEEVFFVIFAADAEPQKRASIVETVNKNFSSHVEKGTMHIIIAPDRYYHPLTGLPRNYNDSAERVKWRGKQAMDYAIMFYYVHGLTQYYLQLEDDVVPVDDFYKLLKDDINKREKQNSLWIIRKYYHMGFIGKLLKSEYLPYVAEFLRTFYFEAPCDWLHQWFLNNVGIKEETGPILFRHIGVQSSSKGT